MTFDPPGLFDLLKNYQRSRDEVQATVLLDPMRGKRAGDGSGTQTRVRVYDGDNLKKTICKPYYIDAGEERSEVDRLVLKHGKCRVVLKLPDDVHSTIAGG